MSPVTIADWLVGTGSSLTVLVVIILIIRKPFARHFGSRAAYALWALPVFRLFVPAINVPILKPQLPTLTPQIKDVSFNYMGVDLLPLVADVSPPATVEPMGWMPILLAVWLTGAVCWLTWQLARQRIYSCHLRVNSKALSGPNGGLHNARLKQAMRKLNFRAPPSIRISKDNSGPLVTGLLRPMIILPANFETHFSPQQQHLALLHEMAHIRRRDLWAAFGALIFRAANWPNPLIHFAAQKFRADQEAACDASVLRLSQSPVSTYAETLIQAAKSAVRPSREAPLGLTIYHPLKERLMMMKTQTKRASLMSRAAAMSIIAAAFTITAPITLAENTTELELAGKAEMSTASRQVIKTVEDTDGVKVKTHYEVTKKDGVTTAYSIDENGVKTEVDPKSIKTKHGETMTHDYYGDHDVEVIVLDDGSGKNVKKRVKVITGGDTTELEALQALEKLEGLEGLKGLEALKSLKGLESLEALKVLKAIEGEHANITVKRSQAGKKGKSVQVYNFSSDHDMDFDFDGNMQGIGQGQHAEIMVETASGLLDGVKTDELSKNAKRKIEKARKALKEAQDAIGAEK